MFRGCLSSKHFIGHSYHYQWPVDDATSDGLVSTKEAPEAEMSIDALLIEVDSDFLVALLLGLTASFI